MKALSAVFGGGWAFWALAALLFALLCWHLAANLLGMRPRRGTLEWIAERPAFSMEYGPGLGRDDLWPMAAAAAAVLLFRSFDGALTVRAAGVSGLDAAEYILLLTVSPVCASLGGYTLTKRFSGGPLAPLFGALLLGLNAGSPRALPFLAFSALFCLYHASGKAGAAWLSVLAGAAFWALAAYFEPGCRFYGAALWLLLLADAAIALFAVPGKNGARLLLTALLFPLFAAAFWLLANLPGAAFAGVPVFSAEFPAWIFARAKAFFTPARAAVTLLPGELAVCAYAVFAGVFCLADFFKTRQYRELAAVWLLAASAVLLFASGVDALVLGCLPALGCLWRRRLSRGGAAPVFTAAGILIAVSAFFCVLPYLSIL